MKTLSVDLSYALEQMDKIELTPAPFTFNTSVAAMTSSRFEGEELEIDGYAKHKAQHMEYKPDFIEKTIDLNDVYECAKQSSPLEEKFSHNHTYFQNICCLKIK